MSTPPNMVVCVCSILVGVEGVVEGEGEDEGD
jgi:hypothetical protein